jgi:hypothetical protein
MMESTGQNLHLALALHLAVEQWHRMETGLLRSMAHTLILPQMVLFGHRHHLEAPSLIVQCLLWHIMEKSGSQALPLQQLLRTPMMD